MPTNHPTYHLHLTQRPRRRQAEVFVSRVGVDVHYTGLFKPPLQFNQLPAIVTFLVLGLKAGQRTLNEQYPNWPNPYVKQLPEELYEAGGMKFSGNEYSTEPNCCQEP